MAKFKLNASAKPFVFNPSAVAFIPSPSTSIPSPFLSPTHSKLDAIIQQAALQVTETDPSLVPTNTNNSPVDDMTAAHGDHTSPSPSECSLSSSPSQRLRYTVDEMLSLAGAPLSNEPIELPMDLISHIARIEYDYVLPSMEMGEDGMCYSVDPTTGLSYAVPMMPAYMSALFNEQGGVTGELPPLASQNSFDDSELLINPRFDDDTPLKPSRRRESHMQIKKATGSPPLTAQRRDLYFEQDLHLPDLDSSALFKNDGFMALTPLDDELRSKLAAFNADDGNAHTSFSSPASFSMLSSPLMQPPKSVGSTILGLMQNTPTNQTSSLDPSFSASLMSNKKKKKGKKKAKEREPLNTPINTKGNGRKGANEKPPAGTSHVSPPSAASSVPKSVPSSAPSLRRGASVRRVNVKHDEALLADDEILPLTSRSDKWIRQSADLANDDESVYADKMVRSILNKLTPEKFDRLLRQLINDVPCTRLATLKTVVDVIFDKAVTEPNFAPLYARFCADLSSVLPEFTANDDDPSQNEPNMPMKSFRVLLLEKCYHLLICDPEAEALHEAGGASRSHLERAEREQVIRLRQKGNMVLIGELFKHKLLARVIMHQCLDMLLDDIDDPAEADVESLCVLLNTVGAMLDEAQPANYDDDEDNDRPARNSVMDRHFERIEKLSRHASLPSRLRFMVLDVVDLRSRNWIPRIQKTVDPKTLKEIHQELTTPKPFTRTSSANTRKVPSTVPAPRNKPMFVRTASSLANHDNNTSGSSHYNAGSQDVRNEQRSKPSPLFMRSASAPDADSQQSPAMSGVNHSSSPGHHLQWKRRAGNLAASMDDSANDTTPSSASSSPLSCSVSSSSSRSNSCSDQPSHSYQEGLDDDDVDDEGAADDDYVNDEKFDDLVCESTSGGAGMPFAHAERKVKALIEEYLVAQDIAEAKLCLSELPSSCILADDCAAACLSGSYDRSDTMQLFIYEVLCAGVDSVRACDLIRSVLDAILVGKNLLSSTQFVGGLSEFVCVLPDLLIDCPKALTHLSQLLTIISKYEEINIQEVCLTLAPLAPHINTQAFQELLESVQGKDVQRQVEIDLPALVNS